MDTKTFVGLVFAAVLPLAAFVWKLKPKGRRSSATIRLGRLIVQSDDYLIFVGIPLKSPTEWAPATRQGEDTLNVSGHGPLHVSEVRAFVVAYANGQVIDAEPHGLPLPEGLTGLAPATHADSDVLSPEELEPGKAYVQVTYGPSATRPKDRNHYATTLKNISTERIRVQRFAGYRRRRKDWELFNVTRQFYSAEEFRQWYGLGAAEWIEPGQSVADPNNYGSPPVLWAYYCESASGKQFIAGGVLESK